MRLFVFAFVAAPILVSGCCDSAASSGNSRGESIKVSSENKPETTVAPPRATAPQVTATAAAVDPKRNLNATAVRFEKGASSAEIKGGAERGGRARYSLGAHQGQTMEISISSVEDNAVFSVEEPDGTIIPGTEEERDLKKWTGTLPHSGSYVISVGATRGGCEFTLKVGIR